MGFLLLIIGIAGVVLPVLPGTIFLILSLACFARSNPRMESWMLEHPRFGPGLREWRETGAMRPPIKALVVICILLGVGSTMGREPTNPISIGMAVIGLVGIGYVLSRPSLVKSEDPRKVRAQ